jgi:DNA-binding transcriptional LysR family regulator
MDLLDQMATFVQVVDSKSLSAAARAHRISLPAVSRQLRALELDLGATLIVRSTRRLHITDAGREWYQRCVRILREIDEARAAVRPSNGVRGTLVVSASVTFGSVVIVPRLARLLASHPQLAIELRLEDHLVDLVGEGVDVALRTGPLPPDSTAYVAHPIATMQRILVASPRWLRKHGAPRQPQQLAGCQCLVQVTSTGALVRWSLRRGPDDEPTEVRDVSGAFRSNAPLALRDLAVDGGGIAYLPEWLVADAVARGRLRRVLPGWSSPHLTAWAVHRTELRGAPRLRALLDAMPGMVSPPP